MSFLTQIWDALSSLANDSGSGVLIANFAGYGWQNLADRLFRVCSFTFAIVKGFEPLLLLPIAFGMLFMNLPFSECERYAECVHYSSIEGFVEISREEAYLIDIMCLALRPEYIRRLFSRRRLPQTGILGSFIANPKSFLLGAAAQLGIFITFIGAAMLV